MSSGSFPDAWHFIVEVPQKGDERSFDYDWSVALDDYLDMSGDVYKVDGPVKFKASLSRSVLGVEIKVKVLAKVLTKCVRCLSSLEVAIEEDFGYCYTLRPGIDETESDCSDPGDSVIITLDRFDKVLDITKELWECFIVSLPKYPSCPKGCELLGPSSTREEGEAEDPRFQILADNFGSFTDEGGNIDGNTKK